MAADQSACTRAIIEETPDAAVISNLGAASYHLIDVEDRSRNFYLTGAMGSTTPLGLGLAVAIEDQVTVIDGDGSLLMSLGSLATVAGVDPQNLTLVVMDNGAFETTGGQPTLSGTADLAAVARDCNLAAWTATGLNEFRETYSDAVEHAGASVIVCEVEATEPEDHPPIDYAHAHTKYRFRQEFVGQ